MVPQSTAQLKINDITLFILGSFHGKKTSGASKIGNSTDKLEADRALILPPSLHQCSVSKVFKAIVRATQKGEILTQGRDVRGHRSRDLAHRTLYTNQHPCSLTAALIKQII